MTLNTQFTKPVRSSVDSGHNPIQVWVSTKHMRHAYTFQFRLPDNPRVFSQRIILEGKVKTLEDALVKFHANNARCEVVRVSHEAVYKTYADVTEEVRALGQSQLNVAPV